MGKGRYGKPPWSTAEDAIILKQFEKHGMDWDAIAEHLPGRTGMNVKYHCFDQKSPGRLVLPGAENHTPPRLCEAAEEPFKKQRHVDAGTGSAIPSKKQHGVVYDSSTESSSPERRGGVDTTLPSETTEATALNGVSRRRRMYVYVSSPDTESCSSKSPSPRSDSELPIKKRKRVEASTGSSPPERQGSLSVLPAGNDIKNRPEMPPKKRQLVEAGEGSSPLTQSNPGEGIEASEDGGGGYSDQERVAGLLPARCKGRRSKRSRAGGSLG